MRSVFLSLAVAVLGCRAIPANVNGEDAKDYINRGNAWRDQGEHDKAITAFTEAIRLAPHEAAAYFNRGLAWSGKHEYDKAIADYDEALRLNPSFYQVYVNRGIAWGKKGEYGKAIADYSQTPLIKPMDTYAYNGLAWLYATCPDEKYRNGQKAVENATKAYQSDGGQHWYFLGTLAAAYAQNGDFAKAVEWQAKAIEVAAADQSVPAKDKADAASRLELYKQGKPSRDEPKTKSAG